MNVIPPGAPTVAEYAGFYSSYIDRVAHHPHALAALEGELNAALDFYRSIPDSASRHRYAPGKWSIRELLGHINDSERVFAYRALAFARGDQASLPGFDQDAYLAAAEFDGRPWNSLVEEFALLRQASIALFRHLPATAWLRSGEAWNRTVSVRALGFITAGHEAHHREILRLRYLG